MATELSRPTSGPSGRTLRPAAVAHRDDLARLPGRNRQALAAERPIACLLERDRAADRAVGRLVDEDGPGARRGLEARGRVDDVAGHHPLADRADGDRRLAADDAGPRGELRQADLAADRRDRGDQLDRRADRPLGVVLAGDRRTPHRHHGVADELLDRPAVAVDDRAAGLEVPSEELLDLLGIAVLRERREADEVGEQDRHEPALGRRSRRLAGPAGDRLAVLDPRGRGDRRRAGRGRAGDERDTARPAEAEAPDDRGGARRTALTEGAPASAAEARGRRVLRATGVAAHRHRDIIALMLAGFQPRSRVPRRARRRGARTGRACCTGPPRSG